MWLQAQLLRPFFTRREKVAAETHVDCFFHFCLLFGLGPCLSPLYIHFLLAKGTQIARLRNRQRRHFRTTTPKRRYLRRPSDLPLPPCTQHGIQPLHRMVCSSFESGNGSKWRHRNNATLANRVLPPGRCLQETAATLTAKKKHGRSWFLPHPLRQSGRAATTLRAP